MDVATILGLVIFFGWYGYLCFGKHRYEDVELPTKPPKTYGDVADRNEQQ